MSAAPTPKLRKVLPEQGWTPSYWGVSQDRTLSFRALGLHTYLMSMPEGWRISSDRVAAAAKEGRDAIQTALRELETAGLYEVVRTRGTGGKFITYGVVYAVPKTPETVGLIGAEQLAMLRKGAYIVNAARGGVAVVERRLENRDERDVRRRRPRLRADHLAWRRRGSRSRARPSR